MKENAPQPIVIRRVVRPVAAAGGSWKVAFADFAVAMMAFFLLLWLVNAVDQEKRGAISEYFRNPSRVEGATDVPTQDSIQGPGGANTSIVEFDNASLGTSGTDTDMPEEDLLRAALEEDRRRLEELRRQLALALSSSESMRNYAEQIQMDIVDEGLRIEVLDRDNRPMFDSGSDKMAQHAVDVLMSIAGVINQVENPISISGHTDSFAFQGRENYTNWELSTDRANAARRALVGGGLEEEKLALVSGRADSSPYNTDDPFSASNRRITIVVLKQSNSELLKSLGL